MGSSKTHRVFVTGYGIVSAFGNSWQECRAGFQKKENKVIYMPEYTKVNELKSYLASPILNYEPMQVLTRKDKRSMGRVSLMSVHAAQLTMQSAGLILNDGSLKFGELTFSSASGTCKWNPSEQNKIYGDLIQLPMKKPIPQKMDN